MRRLDRVVALSVEGVDKSAIARFEGLLRINVDCWLELAAAPARRSNAAHLHGHNQIELQLDEMSTFPGTCLERTWRRPVLP